MGCGSDDAFVVHGGSPSICLLRVGIAHGRCDEEDTVSVILVAIFNVCGVVSYWYHRRTHRLLRRRQGPRLCHAFPVGLVLRAIPPHHLLFR